MYLNSVKNRKTEKQKNRKTEKQKNRKTEKQKNRKTEKQKNRKINLLNHPLCGKAATEGNRGAYNGM
ncbi:no significant database match found [Morganella morganii IS15]|nr:no significant database match found [Morganella morganii IS15]